MFVKPFLAAIHSKRENPVLLNNSILTNLERKPMHIKFAILGDPGAAIRVEGIGFPQANVFVHEGPFHPTSWPWVSEDDILPDKKMSPLKSSPIPIKSKIPHSPRRVYSNALFMPWGKGWGCNELKTCAQGILWVQNGGAKSDWEQESVVRSSS